MPEKNDAPGPEQVKYVQHVISSGGKVFKYNCAVCHCPPTANCEPSDMPYLPNLFRNLPSDSLAYYEAFVKDSKRINVNTYEPHHFSETLSDSLTKMVIYYLWITSRQNGQEF